MNFIIGLVVLLLGGTCLPGTMAVPPQAVWEFGATSHEPPPCREPSQGEMHERGLDNKGKAATYSLDGEYHCEHQIFDFGERSPYVDFVVREASARAGATARAAAQLVAAKAGIADLPWTVEVKSESLGVEQHVRTVFEEALARSLGAGKVAHAPHFGLAAVHLLVTTREVQDVDLLFEVTAKAAIDGGQVTWKL